MQVSRHNDIPGFYRSLIQAISKSSIAFLGVVERESDRLVFVNDHGLTLFEQQGLNYMTGYANFSFFSQPLTEEQVNAVYEEAMQQGSWHRELEFITAAGKTFWGKIGISPFNFEGKDFFFVQIEKKERVKGKEGKLADEKQLSGVFLDNASIGIVIANAQGRIERINPFALQLFGYEEKDVLEKEIELLIPSRFHVRHIGHRNRFAHFPQNRPMGTGMDLFGVRKDGTEFPVEVSLGTYTPDDEKFMIAFISDITIRKSTEIEIKKLNDELESKVVERTRQLTDVLNQLEESEKELKKLLEKEKELSELKTRFVSMASHEFRTPLSTILSSAYLLGKYTDQESQARRVKHIDRIISSVNMLTDILNDFLSVGKIEEGKIVVRPTVFNVGETIMGIVGDISNLQKKGQRISYEHTGEETVTCDLSLLNHIVINLVANAVKFSPENSVVEVTSETKNGFLTLKVRDFGIGISREDQEHLFERFYRGANAVNIQGTGLGLHIVARYIEFMGGEITCESELGKGTLFAILVPLIPSDIADDGN